MNRIRSAVILGLVLFAANERAVPVTAATQPSSPAPIQIILRLADPPVSAMASPGRRALPRHRGNAAENQSERAYFRTLQRRQASLALRLQRMGVRIVARYQV